MSPHDASTSAARRASRLSGLAAVLAAGLLAACTVPPPEAYTSVSGTQTAASRPAGPDARGDNCIAQAARPPALDRPAASGQEVFCGGWTQPSARIFTLRGPATPADLDQLAAGGVWRRALEERVICADVEQTRLVDGTPARILRCTRRQGGWPHIAVVTAGAEGPVVADGIPSALPVIERLARGIAAPAAGAAAARSDALQIEVVRLASRAFGSNDIRDYERAMALGQELNIAEDYAGAEDAYRAALAIQERVLGANNPNTAGPMMHLALNLSNQQRFREADLLFERAGTLATSAADPLVQPRLLHYRGLHALNQGRGTEAGALLARAETLYQPYVPASLLTRGAVEDVAGAALASPTAQSAVMGLAEVRRARATVLARAGQNEESIALTNSARDLLRRVSFDRGAIAGRSLRTEAAALAESDPRRAADLLGRAADRIGQAAPGQQRSEARTRFMAGERRLQSGATAAALDDFRAGAAILRERRLSLEPEQVLAYLDALAAEAARDRAAAPALQREMFAAAQFAQRGQTVRFVTQSAARLAAGGGDGRASDAVRRLQDIDRELREFFAERDALGAGGSPAARAALDERISAKLRERDDTESEVAAAAPGYRQLLLGTVTAEDTARVLSPREAMVKILLGSQHGYALAVRPDGSVLARRVDVGDATAAALVARLRSGLDQPDAAFRNFDTGAAHELYTRLFAPVAAALEGAERLTVIPDGPLLAIPFGMLLAEPANPDALAGAAWLIRRHSIVHATSAQAVVTLRNGAPASGAPRAYIGFGDFEPPTASQLARSFPADRCAEDARLAGGLVRLPGTREEVRIAASLSGADQRATLFGPAFTQQALRTADLGTHRIIHLATHALLPGELSCVQEPSVVVSTAPGAADASSAFLRASQVLDMRLDADLIILSACNTAGPASGIAGATGSAGEALSGLARSFFYAGARGLLVTHWPAVDQAAAITVADMMRRQEAGADSATALRGAQLLLLDEAGRGLPALYAHPYFWAGFALIGDGRRGPPARLTTAETASTRM